jgi:hypothetical protein
LFDQVDVYREGFFRAVGSDLTCRLGARQTGPADEYLCRFGLAGLGGGRPDLLTDRHRVAETLEGECVLFEAVDAEKRRLRPEADHEEVVLDTRFVGEFHLSVIDVDIGDLSLAEGRPFRGDLLDRDRDLLANARLADQAVGLVKHEVVVLFRDPGERGLLVSAQLRF